MGLEARIADTGKEGFGTAETPKDDVCGIVGNTVLNFNPPSQHRNRGVAGNGNNGIGREAVVSNECHGEPERVGGDRQAGERPSGIDPSDAGSASGFEGLGHLVRHGFFVFF